jgi:hypothetical protein
MQQDTFQDAPHQLGEAKQPSWNHLPWWLTTAVGWVAALHTVLSLLVRDQDGYNMDWLRSRSEFEK